VSHHPTRPPGSAWWATWPLNRIFSTITAIVLVFLCIVMALAARQYLLYRQCRLAVTAGDQLLYQFTSIKGHLSESLVTTQEINLQTLNRDLRTLEQTAEELNNNMLVPDAFKPALLSRADLVGLEVRLRAMRDLQDTPPQEKAELIRSLNSINVGMQQFRLLLGEYTQAILLGLHKIIAGALGLIVVLTCCLLFILNRYLALPVLDLCRRTDRQRPSDTSVTCSLNGLSQQIDAICTRHERSTCMLTTANNLATLFGRPQPIQHIWEEVATILSADPEHLCVWIGSPASNSTDIFPVHSSLSSSPTNDDLLRQIAHCCRKKDEFCRTAHQAMTTLTPALHTFPSSELPAFLRPRVSENHRNVTALSIPLMKGAIAERIITLYSQIPGCLDRRKTLLLKHLLSGLNSTCHQTSSRHTGTSTSPDRRRRYALRFRYAAAGWIGSEIAAEIINDINGVLNYTQTLMDLEHQKTNRPQRTSLLQALMQEEKKIAALVTGMQHLFTGQHADLGHASLSTLFRVLTAVLDKRLQAESINCTFPEPYPDVVQIPAGDLWLVLLTLVQCGRRAFHQAAPLHNKEKRLVVACLNENTTQNRVVLRFTNSTCSWPAPTLQDSAVWPSLAFCRHLLRLHGGDLNLQEEAPHFQAILLDLPCRPKALQ
jgi:hypothetical protein